MPREPRTNWGLVCSDHAPKPDPVLAARPAHAFLGRSVKLAFPYLAHPECLEHMWVFVTAIAGPDWLVGVLDNDPVHNVGAVCGDQVEFTRDEIEAVMD